METPLALHVENVFKSFHDNHQTIDVLKGLSLQVPQGAFHAIMGPSGSGKTTLMHLLSGLRAIDKGTITIGGTPLSGKSDKDLTLLRRREIGIIFQDYNLIPTLTVEENISLPLLLDGKPVPQDHLEQLLELTRLTHRRHQRADCLSGGEAQRTAIARAFIANPKIILADEPTGNLDALAARTFCNTLKTLNQNLHLAILLISHDPQVAAIADTVHILRDGTILDSFETLNDPVLLAKRYLEWMTP
jgi:putative ABC transport system ATP-binding protein